MGRYATHGQEILERDGELVGFNAGFGSYAEHNHGYKGYEQTKQKKLIDENKNHSFNGEIVENPDAIHMMEFDDGKVWLTNDEYTYYTLMNKTDKEREVVIDSKIHNDDRKKYESLAESLGYAPNVPEVVALWDGGYSNGHFDLISTSKNSSELLKKLYAEMKIGNVAISADYSFMFRDRGLSFIILDKLTMDDLLNNNMLNEIEKYKI